MKRPIVVGAITAAAVAACGSDAASELARDAGEMLTDAGQWLADAGAQGGSDAQAQAPAAIDARCDKVYERVTTSRVQGTVQATITTTRWYAEIATNTQDVIGVDALKCGHETYGVYASETCAAGDTCTGASMPPRADCQASSIADVAPGIVRIDCGYRQRVDYVSASTPDVDNGDFYKTVRVSVRR